MTKSLDDIQPKREEFSLPLFLFYLSNFLRGIIPEVYVFVSYHSVSVLVVACVLLVQIHDAFSVTLTGSTCTALCGRLLTLDMRRNFEIANRRISVILQK